MANPCDQVEAYGNATSSIFDIGLTSLIASIVVASSVLFSAESDTASSSATASSILVAPIENTALNTVVGSNVLTDQLQANNTYTSNVLGQTQAFLSVDGLAVATGTASSILMSGKDNDVISTAAATSTLFGGAARTPLWVVEQAQATSLLLATPENDVLDSGAAVSNLQQRVTANILAVDTGTASSTMQDASTPGADASNFATAISSVLDHLAANTTAVGYAEATSELFIPPSDSAWVINTESTAMWRYADYAPRWVASIKGKVVGLTGAGLCEVQTSNNVAWRVDTGWSDLGDQHKKRLTYTYVGGVYPAMTRLEVGTELSPAFYAYALINGRATIGRGLNSRYWRFRFSGVGAATINDIRSDVAVSARRI